MKAPAPKSAKDPWAAKKKRWAEKKKHWSKEEKRRWAAKLEAKRSWAKERGSYLSLKGLSLGGRLVDEAGLPVPGAALSLEARPSKGRPVAKPKETISDQEGRFQLHAQRRHFRLLIRAPEGLQSREISLPWTDQDELELGDLTLGRATSFTGLVYDPEGKPALKSLITVTTAEELERLRAAENVAYLSDPPRPVATAEADPEGRFTLQLGSGRLFVIASAQGFRSSAPLEINKAGPERHALRLRLRPARSLLVRLEDQAGLPLNGVRVRLVRYGEVYDPKRSQVQAEGQSDSAGQVTIAGLTKRRYQAVAELEGFAIQQANLNLSESEDPSRLKLIINTGARIRGRLIDRRTGQAHSLGLALFHEDDSGRPDLHRIVGKSSSDKEGRFTFEAVNPGRYVLTIGSNEYAPISHKIEVSGQSNEEDQGDIELTPFGQVKITLLDAAGQPQRGLRLSHSFHQQSGVFALPGSTDDAGLLEAQRIALGKNTLTVLDPKGLVMAFHEADFAVKTELTIRLPAAAATLRGRLHGAKDEPQAARQLELRRAAGQALPIVTRTDADGRYEFSAVPPGQYSLHLIRKEAAVAVIELPGYGSRSAGLALESLELVGGETLTRDSLVQED